jgi:hypothetical protein
LVQGARSRLITKAAIGKKAAAHSGEQTVDGTRQDRRQVLPEEQR